MNRELLDRTLTGKTRLSIVLAVLGLVGILLGRLLDEAFYAATLVLVVIIAALASLSKLQRIERQIRDGFNQNEALFNLFTTAGISRPLPQMRNGAIFPDFAATVLRQIVERRPKSIVELGSGTSTLIIGYALKTFGIASRFVSLEQDAELTALYRRRVAEHGLNDFVEVVHAPITDVRVGTEMRRWYDISELDLPERIDLLVVDGPSHDVGPLARYPALPALRARLHSDTIVLTDDAYLNEEAESIVRWTAEDKTLRSQVLDTAKGTGLLRVVTP